MAGSAFAATPVIIDTDMGTDDMMAIALLLSHSEIPIEAITVVNGVAHVKHGAANARRIVATSGRTGIQVFEGRETPLQFTKDFPDEWRKSADAPLSTVNIPPTTKERAETWLTNRLKDAAHPVRILALGPLTNLALALAAANPNAVEEIVMMGGAFHVPGNMGQFAEGNFFLDPDAAARVFRAGFPIRVVPLDATNQVKLDAAFVTYFKATAKGPLGALVTHVLEAAHDDIGHGEYYAWDPLAATALLDPSVASWTQAHVTINEQGREVGRSVIEVGPANAKVAVTVSRKDFDRIFLGGFH
jgi:inosine-uridine nucleoside N-ribohydrolase